MIPSSFTLGCVGRAGKALSSLAWGGVGSRRDGGIGRTWGSFPTREEPH